MRRYKRLKVEGAAYFFTVVTFERRKLFLEPDAVALLNEAISRVQARHPFELEAQVVLPDHLHALWQLPPNDADFSMRWRLIKEGYTKQWVRRHGPLQTDESRRRKGEQPIWQRRFWEHLIADDTDFGAHLDYIQLNPVQHGLVTTPLGWPHSTYHQWLQQGVYEPTWGTDVKPQVPEWARAFDR